MKKLFVIVFVLFSNANFLQGQNQAWEYSFEGSISNLLTIDDATYAVMNQNGNLLTLKLSPFGSEINRTVFQSNDPIEGQIDACSNSGSLFVATNLVSDLFSGDKLNILLVKYSTQLEAVRSTVIGASMGGRWHDLELKKILVSDKIFLLGTVRREESTPAKVIIAYNLDFQYQHAFFLDPIVAVDMTFSLNKNFIYGLGQKITVSEDTAANTKTLNLKLFSTEQRENQIITKEHTLTSNSTDSSYALVAKTPGNVPTPTKIWEYKYRKYLPVKIVANSAGFYFIGTNTDATSENMIVIAGDLDEGIEKWRYIGPDSSKAVGLKTSQDGVIALGSTSNSVLLLKLDPDGSLAWQETWQPMISFNSLDPNNLIVDSNGNIYATAVIDSSSTTLIKYSDDGILLYITELPEINSPVGLALDSQEDIIVGGMSGEDSSRVIKLTENITSVQASSSTIPTDFRLEQNYPNPFNPSTTISYSLPKNSDVVLKVFDLSGREVAMLVKAKQTAGSYAVQFNGSNLSSGAYFYQLRAGDFTQIRCMTLLK